MTRVFSKSRRLPSRQSHKKKFVLAERASGLATAIEYLWQNPGAVEQMGRNCKNFADRECNDAKVFGELESIYREVLS